MFSIQTVFQGIDHITDAMGVCMTLLHGNRQALLFDTGYGTEDVSQVMSPYGGLKQTVLLSHAHHDHILGSRWFQQVLLSREDFEEYELRTGPEQRQRVAGQAKEKGVPLPEDFLTAVCPSPTEFITDRKVNGFDCREMDLGDLPVQILKVPGHTPGSLMIYCPEQKLLLTGDNWNPCTWLWFPSSVPAGIWRENIQKIMEQFPFEYVLCSHQSKVRSGNEMRRYVDFLTDRRLEEAEPVCMDEHTDTRRVIPDGQDMCFVFDYQKWKSGIGGVRR